MSEILNRIIGTGVTWPIILEDAVDENGSLIPNHIDEHGNTIYKKGWYTVTGSFDLIKQNLSTLISSQIGFWIRNENFGTRIEEIIEEPNNQAASFLIKKYLTQAIAVYEPRVVLIQLSTTVDQSQIKIELNYKLKNSDIIQNLSQDYLF